jgi:hypothetical protein
MATRKAHARWTGSLKEGKGSVDFGDGLFKGAYSFTSRFGAGYVDEELAKDYLLRFSGRDFVELLFGISPGLN